MTEISREQQIPTYKNVVEFVENYLSVVYRRQVSDLSDTVWCPEWWKHTEAIARLDAMWRAWEHLRQDGATGMSVWFLDHADQHMAVLLDPKGPFKYCSVRHGHKDMLVPLPLTAPPDGMFSDPFDTTEEAEAPVRPAGSEVKS
ncbi:DUF4913 domain-containing protein [Nocardia fusca]|uniref:DUF4913 domain-containing protein n=1 Tax=Nocardia fusca TaxID=941183 RepID=A0ABV3FCP0_9NOCA|nr:DUF4913 domain-containing protein [Nocardia fusca]